MTDKYTTTRSTKGSQPETKKAIDTQLILEAKEYAICLDGQQIFQAIQIAKREELDRCAHDPRCRQEFIHVLIDCGGHMEERLVSTCIRYDCEKYRQKDRRQGRYLSNSSPPDADNDYPLTQKQMRSLRNMRENGASKAQMMAVMKGYTCKNRLRANTEFKEGSFNPYGNGQDIEVSGIFFVILTVHMMFGLTTAGPASTATPYNSTTFCNGTLPCGVGNLSRLVYRDAGYKACQGTCPQAWLGCTSIGYHCSGTDDRLVIYCFLDSATCLGVRPNS